MDENIEWGDCFHLAKKAIKQSVEEHQRLVSKRNNLFVDHVPRLVDLAAERLGNLSAEDSDSLECIPPVILGSYIWKWHKVSYTAFRRGLLCLSSDPDFKNGDPISVGSTNNIDEW
jgi:hypothetical protein